MANDWGNWASKTSPTNFGFRGSTRRGGSAALGSPIQIFMNPRSSQTSGSGSASGSYSQTMGEYDPTRIMFDKRPDYATQSFNVGNKAIGSALNRNLGAMKAASAQFGVSGSGSAAQVAARNEAADQTARLKLQTNVTRAREKMEDDLAQANLDKFYEQGKQYAASLGERKRQFDATMNYQRDALNKRYGAYGGGMLPATRSKMIFESDAARMGSPYSASNLFSKPSAYGSSSSKGSGFIPLDAYKKRNPMVGSNYTQLYKKPQVSKNPATKLFWTK